MLNRYKILCVNYFTFFSSLQQKDYKLLKPTINALKFNFLFQWCFNVTRLSETIKPANFAQRIIEIERAAVVAEFVKHSRALETLEKYVASFTAPCDAVDMCPGLVVPVETDTFIPPVISLSTIGYALVARKPCKTVRYLFVAGCDFSNRFA